MADLFHDHFKIQARKLGVFPVITVKSAIALCAFDMKMTQSVLILSTGF